MLFALPLLPALSALALAALPVRSRAWLGVAAMSSAAATLALALQSVVGMHTGEVAWSDTLVLTAAFTPLSAIVSVLVPLVALPVLLYAAAHEKSHGLRRLLAILLAFVGGMQLLVIADDFLTLLIGWELVGACSWALIGHDWHCRDGPGSARYAFVATRLGDVGLIVAALATYAGTGAFAFAGVSELGPEAQAVVAAGVLVSAAAKSGQIPFSPWLFRAMDGPTSVSALLHSATMVAAGAYLLARLQPELSGSAIFGAGAILIGLGTALAGGVVALLQPHAKKLLAASTSAQYGLMFVAVGVGHPALAILHLVAHALFKALLFLVAGVAGALADSFALGRMGFFAVLPGTALASLAGALALAAVPPLGAAWTKEAIAAAAGHEAVWIAAGVLLAGALSAAYATRFQTQAFGPALAGCAEDDRETERPDPGPAERAAFWILAGLTLSTALAWFPPVGMILEKVLGEPLPHPGPIETVLSLGLIALGILAGQVATRRYPGLGTAGRARGAADWLGLPTVILMGIARPVDRVALLAARFDDEAFDALPRGVTSLVRAVSASTGRGDRRLLDGGVRLTVRLTEALARAGSRTGEFLTDGLPTGIAALTSQTGRDLQRLQTGLSHHYYAILAVGTALMAALLIAGS